MTTEAADESIRFVGDSRRYGMNIIEKIMARASGATRVKPGDVVVVDVDTVVLYDGNFFPAYWRDLASVKNPDSVVVVFDHRVPAPDRTCAKAHNVGRKFVEKFGIKRFHDVGRDQGISHVIVAQHGYALPGTVLVCSDSHTGSGGAFNCAARGTGGPDIIYALAKGKTWFRVAETVRYDLTGKLQHGVSSKDLFLHIASRYGDHSNQNLEFGGPALADLSIDARRTLATMGTELNADFTIFEPDQIMIDYVRERTQASFDPQYPDNDANYAHRRTIDLNHIEPLIALPGKVIRNAVGVSEVKGERIQQAFIGSCANGNFDDLDIAAKILDGRRIAPGVRLIVTPGSQAIYRQALEAGIISILMDAGAVVTNATCGACQGGHMGVLGPGETCITASTRNFSGRMGDPTARIFMASPATVAASALTGTITHPGQFLRGVYHA
jgi:3-isopropylmalate/(R)-2-methylmalate dehydratase large subunit